MFKTIQDIQNLIDEEIPESQTLDYKFSFDLKDDKSLAYLEISKDITGLANTKGGYLIYGVTESKTKINCPEAIVGIESNIGKADVIDWLNTFMTNGNVTPKVNYIPHKIPTGNGDKIVLVLEIPESFNKPHMVKFNKSHCYYTRSATSTDKADHNDVQNMFEFKNNFLTKFSDFKKKLNIDDGNLNLGLNPNTKNLGNNLGKASDDFILINFTPYDLNRNISFIRDDSFNSYIRSTFQINNNITNLSPNKRLNQFGLFFGNQNYSSSLNTSFLQIYKNGAAQYADSRFLVKKRVLDGEPVTPYFTYEWLINYLTTILYHQVGLCKSLDSELWNLQFTFCNIENTQLQFVDEYFSFMKNSSKFNDHSLIIDIDYTKEQLNNDGIREIVSQFSDQLVSAFGLEVKFEDMISRIGYEQTIAPFQRIIT